METSRILRTDWLLLGCGRALQAFRGLALLLLEEPSLVPEASVLLEKGGNVRALIHRIGFRGQVILYL